MKLISCLPLAVLVMRMADVSGLFHHPRVYTKLIQSKTYVMAVIGF